MKGNRSSNLGKSFPSRFVGGLFFGVGRGLFLSLLLFSVVVRPCRAEWVERVPDVSHSLNGVAFGNDVFVAVGDYGEITRSSDDGETWHQASSTGDDFNAVAYGNGIFLAVGEKGRVSRSSDGENWIEETSISGSPDLKGIAYGGGIFLAVGEDGHAYRSSNGATWSDAPVGSALYLNAVAYGNGWFVTVGNSGRIYRSNDGGANWERISGGSADLYAIAFGNNTFVAVGQYAFRSLDNGENWEALALDHVKNGVAFGENRFVVCGSYGIVFESDEGSSSVWTSVDTGGSGLYSVAFGNHVFAAGGLLRTLYTEGTAASGIAPQSATVESAGDSKTVSVSAPDGFVWTAASPDSWIHIVSGASGSGDGTVAYNVDSNPSATSRDGTVQLAGFVHSVHQNANTDPTSIYPDEASFEQSGGSGSIQVSAPIGRGWSAVPSKSWISIVSGSPGSGDGTVNYAVAANTSGSARSGTIVIDGEAFSITQEIGTLSVSPVNKRFYYTGGSGSFDVDTYAGDVWTPISGEAWISITSYGGNGSGPVNYSVAQNDTGYFRSGEISVDGVVHTVEQEGRFPYILNPVSGAYAAQGGTQRITLSTNPSDRPWTAKSDSPWLQISGATNGTGSGHVDVRVVPNASALDRVGLVRIGDNQYATYYRATQNGRTPSYSIAPSSAAFPGSGGNARVRVSATEGAEWSATGSVAWISFSSDSGTGNGSVVYAVDPNPTTNARNAVLTIAGKSHSVSQASGDTPDRCWLDPSHIRENLPTGTTVGTLHLEAYLPVATPLFSFAPLADNGSDVFSISNNLLLSTVSFDAESKHCYLPAIRAENGHDGAWEGRIPVIVDDDTLEDADGDGLPEEDEIFQGSEDTVADFDGDGQSDGDEVRVTGTDPLDFHSFLRIAYFERTGSVFDMQWPTKSGKTYRVFASDNLEDGFPFLLGETKNGFFDCPVDAHSHRFFQLAVRAPTVLQQAKLLAYDGVAEDRFGDKVAIDGDTLVVGAKHDDDLGSKSGSAYVYQFSPVSNAWNFVAKLTASDGASGDQFGYAVDIDGDTIVVGAKADDSARGSAYVFDRDEGGANQWGEVKKLLASDGVAQDYFGYAVSISGDRIAVGAIWEDGQRGAAYLFERNFGGADHWGEVKKLIASDAEVEDCFGGAISLSGDTVAVGAFREDEYGTDAGAAYLFDCDQGGASQWGQIRKIVGRGELAGDSFGVELSLDGDTLAVSANNDDERASHAGAAYLFERDQGGTDQWGQIRKIRFVDGSAWDLFSGGIDLDGDNLVVGAWNARNANGLKTGTAFLFQRDLNGTDRWGLLQRFAADNGTDGAGFGWKVSVSGTNIVAGAPSDTETANKAGAVYLFKIEP